MDARERTDRGFTLVELLVVIGVIAVVIGLLLPMISHVRGAAQTSACASNLRQLGQAFVMYASQNEGALPWVSTGPKLDEQGQPPYWNQLVTPYMNQPNGSLFGYVTDEERRGFMPCPSRKDRDRNQTYSVNYPVVFGHYTPGHGGKSDFDGSMRLARIPAHVFLAADGKGGYHHVGSIILHPGPGFWVLNTDTDGDGVLDSNSGELNPTYLSGVGPYNGLAPVHRNHANFLFADGSVRLILGTGWAGNQDGLWGPTTPFTRN